MSWSYRVLRFEEKDEALYQIHECHYDKKGDTIPTSWTAEPVHILSETRDGLLWHLCMMAEAIEQPVLEVHEGKLREVEPEKEFGDEIKRVIERVKKAELEGDIIL